MLKKFYTILFLAIFIFFSACSGNTITCKSSTSVRLKDGYTLNIGIEFGFNTEKEMREFKYEEKNILFAIRLSMKQHESSMLKKKGKNNAFNAIIAICKQRLKNKSVRVKITKYNFTNT